MAKLREGQKATIKANIEVMFFDQKGQVTDYFRRLLDSAIDQALMEENHTLEDAEQSTQHLKTNLVISSPVNMTLRTK